MINSEQLLFIGYIALLILFTSVHSLLFLILSFLVLVLFTFRKNGYIFKKVIKVVSPSLLIISLSYLLAGFWKEIDLWYLPLINLRVFLLTYLTFVMITHINLFKVFAFSAKLTFLISLSYAQMHTFQRTFTQLQLGYLSRTPNPTLKIWLKSLYATLFYFMNKTLHTSTEVAHGMKSRGMFDD